MTERLEALMKICWHYDVGPNQQHRLCKGGNHIVAMMRSLSTTAKGFLLPLLLPGWVDGGSTRSFDIERWWAVVIHSLSCFSYSLQQRHPFYLSLVRLVACRLRRLFFCVVYTRLTVADHKTSLAELNHLHCFSF